MFENPPPRDPWLLALGELHRCYDGPVPRTTLVALDRSHTGRPDKPADNAVVVDQAHRMRTMIARRRRELAARRLFGDPVLARGESVLGWCRQALIGS